VRLLRAAYNIQPEGQGTQNASAECLRCGYWHRQHLIVGHPGFVFEFVVARLRTLDINDADLGLRELGAHLRRSFGDVYAISPNRFEQLVGDVFGHLGYSVRLTQASHDGGYDLLLLDGRTGRDPVIVQCKRYSQHRPVRVGVVREVMGVQLVMGIRKAKIVTTSRFTDAAQKTADQLNQGPSGFEMDLLDAQALAETLGVYNMQLPPSEIVRRFSNS
jgi:restriction endonuclease Mrr